MTTNKLKNKTAVVYIGGTIDQEEYVKNQELVIKKFVKENNIKIQHTFFESVFGITDLQVKKGFTEVIELCKKNKTDLLLVKDILSLFRNPRALKSFAGELSKLKIAIISAQTGLEIEIVFNATAYACKEYGSNHIVDPS